MKPAPFAYLRPATLEEALAALAGQQGAKVLAGGQSLVPLLSMRLAAPSMLVDINALPDLGHVRTDDDGVRIGALARHADVLASTGAAASQPLLAMALSHVAHPTIRNRGTTVGSLVHADPSAEMPAVLALLGGSVEVRSRSGSREIPAADFFVGPMESAVRPGELAVAALFPRPAAGTGSTFVELARRHGDYAVCGVAALVTTDPDGGVTDAGVALISVGAGPVVVDVTAAATGGAGFAPDLLVDLVDPAIDPEADIHASAEYRRNLAHVLTARALDEARDRSLRTRRDEKVA
jgi:CO/xanthine dehydrogenase FAD-binding subunit